MGSFPNKYVQFKFLDQISFQFYSYAEAYEGSQGTVRNRGVKLNAHNMYIIICWSPDLKKKGTAYFIDSFSSTFTGQIVNKTTKFRKPAFPRKFSRSSNYKEYSILCSSS